MMDVREKEKRKCFWKYLIFLALSVCLLLGSGRQTFAGQSGDGNRETVKAGFFAFEGYHMTAEDGTRSGYGYDFLRMASRFMDVRFEYIGYDKSWSDMQKMLEDGEIDLLTSAEKTSEREEKFDFSEPIGISYGSLNVRADNMNIISSDYRTYQDIMVGMLEGSSRNTQFKKLAEEKGFTYRSKIYDSMEKLEEDLQEGKLDAIVTSSIRAVRNERILEKFNESDFYVIVKKGNTALLEKINYAIDQLNTTENDWTQKLSYKYFAIENDAELTFTEREKELIRQYASSDKKLVACCSIDREPYSYEKNGELKGILPDIFALIMKEAGLSYEVRVPENREEYLSWRGNPEIDLFMDARISSESQLEETDSSVTDSYIELKLARVTRKDFQGDIKTVARASYQGEEGIEDDLTKGVKVLDYPDRMAALEAVRDGKADAAYVYFYTAQEYVNQDETGSLTYTVLNEPSYAYQIVISSQISHELSGILTKCIHTLPKEEVERIISEHTSYKAQNISLERYMSMHPRFVLGLCVLLFGGCYVITILCLKLREKKRRYQNAEKETLAMEGLLQKVYAANISKSRFLFNMSHDIRTPMNAIIGFTDLALKADGDVIQQKKYLTKISIASRHLLALINDILEMSRIESGKVLLKETKCKISQIFGELNTIMAGQIQEKGQKLQIIFCDIQNEEIWCDELRLKQVLINLVGNANKFTPEGGEITITVCQTEKEHNGVAGYRILVKDNGVGMTENFLKRIYEPFEREETSTVSGITGTGLGLSITKSIVDLFGGSMEIRSKKNQGTEVILDLSLKLKPPKEENDLPEENVIVEQDSEQLEFSGKRVLLAEDNDLNCEIAEELLSQKGICVEVAGNGAEAVEKVKNSEPGYYEVILMDIQMPVMDGYEATRQIRSLEDAALAKIPIIALSANAFEEDRRASREAGMDGHLAKPIETAKLFGILKEIIKKE